MAGRLASGRSKVKDITAVQRSSLLFSFALYGGTVDGV